MPKFSYKAKKSPTEIVTGVIEADHAESAVDKIIKLGLSPVDVFLDTKSSKIKSQPLKQISFSFSASISMADVGLFMQQLADLIDAGVPLLRALFVVMNQTRNPKLKDVVGLMHSFVKDGGTLSEAMAQHGHVFTKLYVNMVKSGEVGGNLDVVLSRLAEFIDKDLETRSKIKSSLAYPALIFIVGCLTVFVLVTFVVPRITVIFDDLTESLPWPTVILMAVSSFFAKFWWAVVGLMVLGGVYGKKYFSSPEGKLWLDKKILQIPVLGNFVKNAEIGRFARTLATLLDSGVVIVSALESVWPVLDNEVLKEDIKRAAQEVASGDSLTMALKKSVYFPEVAVNMIAVGEESGHLEQAVYKLADSYERQSDRAIKVVTSLLEPLMIIAVGSIVFFIVMAVVMPIFKMNQIIR